MTRPEFEAIFTLLHAQIYRFCWRMTTSHPVAEDITQQVFLELWQQPARFEPGRGELRSFLFGSARNLILKRYRQERRWSALDDDAFVPSELDVAGLERSDAIAQAVECLPPLQREALILATYEGFSAEEIADAAGTEIGTIKGRLHRARQNLRKMLAPLRDSVPTRGRVYGTTQR